MSDNNRKTMAYDSSGSMMEAVLKGSPGATLEFTQVPSPEKNLATPNPDEGARGLFTLGGGSTVEFSAGDLERYMELNSHGNSETIADGSGQHQTVFTEDDYTDSGPAQLGNTAYFDSSEIINEATRNRLRETSFSLNATGEVDLSFMEQRIKEQLEYFKEDETVFMVPFQKALRTILEQDDIQSFLRSILISHENLILDLNQLILQEGVLGFVENIDRFLENHTNTLLGLGGQGVDLFAQIVESIYELAPEGYSLNGLQKKENLRFRESIPQADDHINMNDREDVFSMPNEEPTFFERVRQFFRI